MDFSTSSAQDLDAVLAEWGRKAPSRLERRGQQPVLDRWVFARFLQFRQRQNSTRLSFPLHGGQQERPDFMVTEASHPYGVVITEACDPAEQARRTQEEKQSSGQAESFDLQNPDYPYTALKIVQQAIGRKTTKAEAYEVSPLVLVMYANSQVFSFQGGERVLGWLENLEIPASPFSGMWLYHDQFCLDLKCRYAFETER